MATVVTRYVNTASSAGGDGTTNGTSGSTRAWATLEEARAALVAAYSSGFVTADVQVELVCSGATNDTTALGTTWPTSDTTRYLHIQVPAADRKVEWDDSVYVYARSTNFAAAFEVRTNTLHMTGVQIAHTGSLDVGGNHGISVISLGGVLQLDGVKVAKVFNAGQVAIRADGIAGTYVFRNVMTFGFTFRFRYGIWLGNLPSNTSAYLYNATTHGAGVNDAISVLFTAGGSAKVARVKNCLTQNQPTGVTVTNATTDDQAGNYHATTTDASFADSAAGDFTLLSGDTKGRDLGTDLSAVGDYPFNIDANEDARNSAGAWDRGAHEFQAPASAILLATQAGIEALALPTPALRATHAGIEALVSGAGATATLRATQGGVEALTLPTPAIRATQAGIEALTSPTAATRATQTGVEALVLPAPVLRATQAGIETLVKPSALSLTYKGQLWPRGAGSPLTPA